MTKKEEEYYAMLNKVHQESNKKHYMTAEESAETIGISVRTLYRYAKNGMVQKYRLGKRNVFYEPDILKLKETLREPKATN